MSTSAVVRVAIGRFPCFVRSLSRLRVWVFAIVLNEFGESLNVLQLDHMLLAHRKGWFRGVAAPCHARIAQLWPVSRKGSVVNLCEQVIAEEGSANFGAVIS